MNRIALSLFTAAAALALATTAQAADAVAPGHDWTGFYLGANAGVSWNNSTIENDVYGEGVRNRELRNSIEGGETAFTAGGLIGYNHQIDRLVLGAEADINYLGFADSNTHRYDLDGDTLTTRTGFEADWFGTIRARLGYAFDNVLVYGTGGAAYGHMSADGKVTLQEKPDDLVWKGSTDSTNWGWTIGAGAEYGIDRWSLGLEYLYVDLGDGTWNSNVIGINDLRGSADYAFSTVRASVKYRFH